VNDRRLGWLFEVFEACASRTFLHWHERPFSYEWLTTTVETIEAAFRDHGIAAGSIVALEGEYSPVTVANLVALIDSGCIVVPLSHAAHLQREEFLDIAQVQHLICVDAGDEQTFSVRPVTVSNSLLCGLRQTGDPGLVLFSSGSTGRSKATLHNFKLLLDKFRTPRPCFITLTFLMLDHIGGLNTLFFVLSNGGTAVAATARGPEEVCATIERFRVELLPTSPTFLNLLLLSGAFQNYDLSSLRRVTYGTEVMPDSLLARLREVFPNVELQQTYGLSEVGILRSKSRNDGSTWMKIGGEGFEVSVREGILWIRARSAMLGYLNADSPFDDKGWFNTGDAVEVDGEYFRVLGRRSELINVGGEKVYPAEVEGVLREMDNVEDVSVFGEPNPITGQSVCAVFKLEAPEDSVVFRRRVRDFARTRLAPYKSPARIIVADRDQYSERFKKMRRLVQDAGSAS
jgi:long-chain acyl-CoA synthetase